MKFLLILLFLVPSVCSGEPFHLKAAKEYVGILGYGKHNKYGRPSYLTYHQTLYRKLAGAQTQCSSFFTLLMRRAYFLDSEDIRNWVEDVSPNAATWHDAILYENHFIKREKIWDIEAGDVFAMRYSSGSSSSGHMGLVSIKPKPRYPTKPLINGTFQYSLRIIDSSRTGHGEHDTRRDDKGVLWGGIGEGTMRIYTDDKSKVIGYTWSLSPHSRFYHVNERSLVFGEVDY